MKLILKILAGLIVVVAVVVGVTVYNLDTIIKTAVVQVGPEVTDTNVGLDSVDLSLLKGTASLRGLVIGNPQGFARPNAFSVDSIAVDLDTRSLGEDVIQIHKVFIEAPEIFYESNDAGDNFQTILDNIARNTGAASPESAEVDDESSKKIIIEELVLIDGNISLEHRLLAGKTVGVPLPDLTLTDIGKKTNGATVQEAASQIIKQIATAAKDAVASSAILQEARQQLDDLKEDARARAEEQIDSKLDELNIGDEQVDKIKGLFKNPGR